MAYDLTAQDIVEAAVTKLSGKTVAGTRVFPWRTTPIQANELPCICVYYFTLDESHESETHPLYGQANSLMVQIHQKGATDAAWFTENNTLTNTCKRALLAGSFEESLGVSIEKCSTRTEQAVDGETIRAMTQLDITLNYDVEYTELDDETVDVEVIHVTDENGLEVEATL